MFRKPEVFIVNQPGRTEYVTRTVNEHRAPTDQSVALLKDMEEAARSKVVESVKVGDATFECVVHTMRDCASDDTIAVAIFSLNGKKMEAKYRHRHDANKVALMEGLRDEMAREIATHILMPALASMR
jgi:hypothetical protein